MTQKIQLSDEQTMAINWVKQNSTGNLAMLSQAGSGKSTLLFEMVHQIKRKHWGWNHDRRILATVVSFNKKITVENKELLPKWARVRTAHSLLGEILYRFAKARFKPDYKRKKVGNEWFVRRVEDEKIPRIIWLELQKEMGISFEEDTIKGLAATRFFNTVNIIESIVRMVHLNAIPHTDLDLIRMGCQNFDIVCNDSDIKTASFVIAKGIEIFETHGIFSNDESLYLTSCYYPFEELKKFAVNTRYLLMDESQDLSDSAHRALRLLVADDTQTIMCADPRQSLYYFAYVSPDSVYNAIETLNADQITLSTTYRCPTTHVELVNRLGINEEIKAREGAAEGSVRSITYGEFIDEARPSDLVLSRNLVGKDLTYSGADIATTLLLAGKGVYFSRWSPVVMLSELMKPLREKVIPNQQVFDRYLSKWQQREEDKENEKDRPSKKRLKLIKDSVEIAQKFFNCYRIMENTTKVRVEKFMQFLASLEEQSTNAIMVGSIHASKGRTHNRTYICNWEEMLPELTLENGCSVSEIKTALNLLYVQLTRATDELVFVDCPVPERIADFETLLSIKNPEAYKEYMGLDEDSDESYMNRP